MGIRRRPAVLVFVVDYRAPRVAAGARLDLHPRGSLHGAGGDAGFEIDVPPAVVVVAQPNDEAFRAGPLAVARARAVARLARDVDLLPGRLVDAAVCVVALVQVGRVALGAHVVPVLLDPGPVQRIVRPDALVRVQVEPALAAVGFRACIPAQAQHLVAAARELDQVLLQRIDPEGVGQRVVVKLAVGPLGTHDERAVTLEEGRGDAEPGEGRVVEVSEHGRRSRGLHREVVVRILPQPVLALVTRGAGIAADVRRRGGLGS